MKVAEYNVQYFSGWNLKERIRERPFVEWICNTKGKRKERPHSEKSRPPPRPLWSEGPFCSGKFWCVLQWRCTYVVLSCACRRKGQCWSGWQQTFCQCLTDIEKGSVWLKCWLWGRLCFCFHRRDVSTSARLFLNSFVTLSILDIELFGY